MINIQPFFELWWEPKVTFTYSTKILTTELIHAYMLLAIFYTTPPQRWRNMKKTLKKIKSY